MIRFHLEMDPVPKGRPRMTRSGHAYTPQKTRDAEAHIKEICKFVMSGKEPMEGPLDVEIHMTFKQPKSNKTKHHTQRPDAENVGKLINDAMNGVIYLDDSQIVSLLVTKKWGEEGGIDVVVSSH